MLKKVFQLVFRKVINFSVFFFEDKLSLVIIKLTKTKKKLNILLKHGIVFSGMILD